MNCSLQSFLSVARMRIGALKAKIWQCENVYLFILMKKPHLFTYADKGIPIISHHTLSFEVTRIDPFCMFCTHQKPRNLLDVVWHSWDELVDSRTIVNWFVVFSISEKTQCYSKLVHAQRFIFRHPNIVLSPCLGHHANGLPKDPCTQQRRLNTVPNGAARRKLFFHILDVRLLCQQIRPDLP
jgi:hypothetical protein